MKTTVSHEFQKLWKSDKALQTRFSSDFPFLLRCHSHTMSARSGALHALLIMSEMVSVWRNPATLEVALFTMTMPSMYHVGPMKVGPNSALCFQAAVAGQYFAVGFSSM